MTDQPATNDTAAGRELQPGAFWGTLVLFRERERVAPGALRKGQPIARMGTSFWGSPTPCLATRSFPLNWEDLQKGPARICV